MPQHQKIENLFKSNPLLSPKVDVYLPSIQSSKSGLKTGGLSAAKSSVEEESPSQETRDDDNNKPVSRGYSYLATNTPTVGNGAASMTSRTPRFSKYGSSAASSSGAAGADNVARQLLPNFGELDGLPGISTKNSKFLSTYSRNFAGSENKQK